MTTTHPTAESAAAATPDLSTPKPPDMMTKGDLIAWYEEALDLVRANPARYDDHEKRHVPPSKRPWISKIRAAYIEWWDHKHPDPDTAEPHNKGSVFHNIRHKFGFKHKK